MVFGCLDSQSGSPATITTRFGIAIPAELSFDSTVCTIYIQGEKHDSVVRYPNQLGDDLKLRWDVVAPEGQPVRIHTDVYYQSHRVATQDLAFVSGDASIRVPAAILAPTLQMPRPWAPLQGLDSVTLWAIAHPTDLSDERQIDSMGWDLNHDGSYERITPGDTGMVRLTWAQIPSDSIVSIQLFERSGRRFTQQNAIGPAVYNDSALAVGPLWWMAQNLNTVPESNEYPEMHGCYAELDSLCSVYGRLYSFASAQKACPAGWRLPTLPETQLLIRFHGGASPAGLALKSHSNQWRQGGGTNVMGFGALPAGIRVMYADWRSDSLGVLAAFWVQVQADSAVLLTVQNNVDSTRIHWNNPQDLASVRCVRPIEE